MSTPCTINLTQSSTPANLEVDALQKRVEALEAALKNMLDAHDTYYRLPADYNDFQARKVTLNRAVERSRAALTPIPEPTLHPEPPAPMEHDEFTALWQLVNTNDATTAQIEAYRAECNRRASVLSDGSTFGKDTREGK